MFSHTLPYKKSGDADYMWPSFIPILFFQSSLDKNGGITSTKLNTYVNNHRPACFFNRLYLPKCGLQQEVCMLMDLYHDLV